MSQLCEIYYVCTYYDSLGQRQCFLLLSLPGAQTLTMKQLHKSYSIHCIWGSSISTQTIVLYFTTPPKIHCALPVYSTPISVLPED